MLQLKIFENMKNYWVLQFQFKCTFMQIEKALINDAYVFKKYPENTGFQLFIILQ